VLAVALSGCEVIGSLLPDELGGTRLAPEDALCIEYEVLATDGQAVTPELLEQTRVIIENRVNATGVAEPIVQTQGTNSISVEARGIEPQGELADEIRKLIGTTGVLEFMPVPAALQGSVMEGPLPEGMEDIEPLFTGMEIASAAIVEDSTTYEIVVDLQLKDTGARLFDEYAEEHFGEQFAIVLDDEVMSAPVIQATRFGGRAQISGGQGGFTENEANRLVTGLKFGPLPLPVREVSAGTCPGTSTSPAVVDQPLSSSPSGSPIAAGPPYPDPIEGVYVYDQAGVLREDTITAVEAAATRFEQRTGSPLIVYTQLKPASDTYEEALSDAAALLEEWHTGRGDGADGLVVLFDLDSSLCHGQVQLYAGAGIRSSYLADAERQAIYEEDMLPALRECDIDGALMAAIERIGAASVEPVALGD
jgi:hypothetical protein